MTFHPCGMDAARARSGDGGSVGQADGSVTTAGWVGLVLVRAKCLVKLFVRDATQSVVVRLR